MKSESKRWRLWINGKASMPMTAVDVLEQLEAKAVSIHTMTELAGDSRSWQALRVFMQDLNQESHDLTRAQETKPQIQGLTSDIGFSLIQILGGWVFALACLVAFNALSMDISIAAESGREINNLGLMNDRMIKMVAAGFAALIGVMMMLLGGKVPKVAQ